MFRSFSLLSKSSFTKICSHFKNHPNKHFNTCIGSKTAVGPEKNLKIYDVLYEWGLDQFCSFTRE